MSMYYRGVPCHAMPVSPNSHLEESWVIDAASAMSDSLTSDEDEVASSQKSSQRERQSIYRFREPDFVMPSIDLEASSGGIRQRAAAPHHLTSHKGASPRDSRLPRRNTAASQERYRETEPTQRKRLRTTRPSFNSDRGEKSSFQQMLDIILDQFISIISWLLEVTIGALRVLKTPLSYIFALWILFGLGLMLRNFLTTSLYASLSPICRLPGATLLDLPFCSVSYGDGTTGLAPPVEFDELMSVQSKIEQVLQESVSGVSLPSDMKRGEVFFRDMRQLVRYSHLPSKNELLLEFDDFIETARIASYDLQRFNSHVGRGVDVVIATTRWTTRALEGVKEKDLSRSSIEVLISDKLLGAFKPATYTETAVREQYIQHTEVVEEEINKLIMEAQSLLLTLSKLEERLDIIHEIATRDGLRAKSTRDEVLLELWTFLGGNKSKLNAMQGQMNLLDKVGEYQRRAYAHVAASIIRLQQIGSGLEDLRERVGAPALLRGRIDVPLSVHIESIERGIERLEEGRQNARMLENEYIKQTLA